MSTVCTHLHTHLPPFHSPALQLTVPDQKLPVPFTLRAQVTTTDLIFDPPALHFGDCVMAEDTGVVLRINNPSALPQTLGFTQLPPGVRISPNDGFGFVLPGEGASCGCEQGCEDRVLEWLV